jgi:predicted phosphodiesterase
MPNERKKEIVLKYLSQFPNLPSRTLATLIYNQNKLSFKDIENVRGIIRHYRGTSGKKNLKSIETDKFLTPKKRIEKYNLPESVETEYKPFSIIGNRGIIFSDTHVPFHNISALETMFDYTINKNIDFIIIAGDGMDCFEISNFCNDPTIITFPEEKDRMKSFLIELKRIYFKAKIYYKFGNHEKRFETYLEAKAPELYGMTEFRLEILLDLFNMGIEFISEDRYIDLSGLSILHGHEYKNAVTSPANPARTFFLRTKDTTIGGHYHQASEHSEPTISGKIINCWSLGCMCDLHPKYMPLNKWVNGFAEYERYDENFWHVDNKKIIENRVV